MPALLFRFAAIAAALIIAAPNPALAGDKQPLRVLYAGCPGSQRETDFLAFLREQFAKAESCSAEKFKPEMADGFDVVLFDWRKIVIEKDGQVRIDLPQVALPERYARATVLIGGMGGMMGNTNKLKLDWL